MTRTIILGNKNPKAYVNNPKPWADMIDSLESVEMWATEVCKLDISDIPAVGTVFSDDYVQDATSRRSMILDRIDQPVLVTSTAVDDVTTIVVSPDSTLLQAVAEIKTIWAIHSHDGAPEYVRYNADAKSIALLIADEFGVVDVQEIAE